MELCMKCKRTGENGFDCGHPNAHTPVFTLTEDANGEPVEQPSMGEHGVTGGYSRNVPNQQLKGKLDRQVAAAEGRAQAANHRANEAEAELKELRRENHDLLTRLKRARSVTYPDRITVANAYNGPQQIAALRRAVEDGARLHEADMRHMLAAVIREYDRRRSELMQIPGGGYALEQGDRVRITVETTVVDYAHSIGHPGIGGYSAIGYDTNQVGTDGCSLELPDRPHAYPDTIITVEKRP